MPRTAKRRPGRSTVFGIGLVALDVIVDRGGTSPGLYAGGTCANVLAILSYLGWKAKPIARLGDDSAANIVRADLRAWGVDLSWASLKPLARTPIVVERLRADRNGVPFHTFSFFCPACGARFPGFQPVTGQTVAPLASAASPDVFFVDRVSKSAVALAEVFRSDGATVVFEPQRADESKLFREMLTLADVVIYSHERIDELPARKSSDTLLEVQTLGRGGLRVRIHRNGRGAKWSHLQAEPVRELRDAAGSGDWLTAGLIHGLRSRPSGTAFELSDVQRALAIGQKLAAWNCGFVGARGGMYAADRDAVLAILTAMRPRRRSMPSATAYAT
jgi:sugar/nucleoside kinase (ribokinase family)